MTNESAKTIDDVAGRMTATLTSDVLKCLAAVRFKYVLGIKRPQSYYLAFGNAWDRTSDSYWIERKQTGRSMAPAHVAEIMDFALREEFGNAEPVSAADETRADMRDQGIALAQTWASDLGQHIEPIAVQEAFKADPGPSLPFHVTGVVDLVGKWLRKDMGDQPFFADAKTSKRRWTTKQAQDSLQPPIYLMAREHLGITTDLFQFHVGVRKKAPEMQVLSRRVDQSDLDLAMNVMKGANRILRDAWISGAWVPNRQHVMCSRKYCPYWRECEAQYGGTVSGAQEVEV